MLFCTTSLIARVGRKRLRNSPSLSERGVFLPVEKNVAEGESSLLFIAAGFSAFLNVNHSRLCSFVINIVLLLFIFYLTASTSNLFLSESMILAFCTSNSQLHATTWRGENPGRGQWKREVYGFGESQWGDWIWEYHS